MHQDKIFSRTTWWVVLVVGIIGLIFLLRTHTAHIFSLLPYLILLLCPLMHLFMGHNHGEHKSDKEHEH